MVFFTCGNCGDSIKKNQVEKHYQFNCKGYVMLSCVDCQKDFCGDTYKEHVKCLTENEKYGGKNYKAKANANKGEKKQEAWTEQVQIAIERANAEPKLRSLLIQIKGYLNIPRKKAKFENFLKNSVRVRDTQLITRAWDLIQAQVIKQNETKDSATEESKTTNSNSEINIKNDNKEITALEVNGDNEKKLNKREKKEERRKKAIKNQKKDKRNLELDQEVVKKKRKHSEVIDIQHENDEECEVISKKKKKKSKHSEEIEDEKPVEEPEITDEIQTVKKFDWEEVIVSVLNSKDEKELSIKKLKKKVLAEFWSNGRDGKIKTEEKASKKFDKKVHKNPRFRVHKEKVKLLQ